MDKPRVGADAGRCYPAAVRRLIRREGGMELFPPETGREPKGGINMKHWEQYPSLMRIRRERFRAAGIWEWGSRPGFLRTREDADLRFRRLEIPAVWEGKRVTGFERMGFSVTSVEEAVFPEGIAEIGKEAFSRACLYELSLPSSIRRIGDYAFSWQDRLRTLTLPEGLEELGRGAFYCCNGLRRIELPASLRRIGEDAFAMDGSQIPAYEAVVFSVPGFWRGSCLLRDLLAPLQEEYISCRVEYRS